MLVFKLTVQAVRRRSVTTPSHFDPRPVHAKVLVSTVALYQASLPVDRTYAVSTIPPTPQTLHLTITLLRKANWRCLGTFTRKNVRLDIDEFRAHTYCHTEFSCRYLKTRQVRTEVTVGVSDSSCIEPEQQTKSSLTLSNHWAIGGLAGARGVPRAARHCSLFTALLPN
jgi:hypothetical protein